MMQGINSVGLSDSIISGDSLSLRSPTVEVLTLADGYANIFGHPSAKYCANWGLKAYLSGNSHFDDNSLISNQAANMQFGHNIRVSFSDAVNLRSSLSRAQKEKDSTANATLWRK
ncbi:hypothetical protein KKJ02_20110, partial [Xenorhabdus bovienii]|nr:hypothetical protein [Xenorhabdus bovienii]